MNIKKSLLSKLITKLKEYFIFILNFLLIAIIMLSIFNILTLIRLK